MFRSACLRLEQWKDSQRRKPLIIRGARQVGKTHLVRKFAEKAFRNVVEINFDWNPEKAVLFQSRNPSEIIDLLEIEHGLDIIPGETLIFLDEIQSAPEVISLLRYFYESIPELHIIAAGSLLEFALSETGFSMPVGRIEYLYLGPMTFEEFIRANEPNGKQLVTKLREFNIEDEWPTALHIKYDQIFRKYLSVGGLPEAIISYCDQGRSTAVRKTLDTLQQTYQDDFAKYRGRVNYLRLRKTFSALPRLVGDKLKYSNIDREETSRELIRCLDLLELAQVFTRVYHSAGNGVPLNAERKETDFKPLFLDVGLASRILGTPPLQTLQTESSAAKMGLLAEQFVGQHLLYYNGDHKRPELSYWRRQNKSANAEIDYLLEHDDCVVPVEVKTGKTGHLKSLHQFIKEKQPPIAIRFNSDQPSLLTLETEYNKSCQLLSLPCYMIDQTKRHISRLFSS
jgi:uncharacterized protein